MPSSEPLLFTSINIRGLEIPNRIVVSPMAQYSAVNGYPVPFHLVHYGKFALGGAGLIILEEAAVTREGRITNGCLGIWEDGQIDALRQITTFIKDHGSVPALQISHCGRKGSTQRSWEGFGPLAEKDIAGGDECWQIMGPSNLPLDEGWLIPKQMDLEDMCRIKDAFVAGAKRAVAAGFEIIEIHMAHGYLLQSFLTPLANTREDEYGGSLENRMRFPLEIAAAIRANVPETIPLFTRISAVDWIDGGWKMDESVVLAQKLKDCGIDLIDCSSGGNLARGAANSNLKRSPGYQAPFAKRIREEVGMMSQAVGLIRNGAHAEDLLQNGSADLIAVGRQFLFDPFWALHAAEELGTTGNYEKWPKQYAWWLEKWSKGLRASGKEPMIVRN